MTTQKISREQVKAEIDQLDSEYLGLAYRVIRQFPHRAEQRQRPSKPTFSRRWLGKLQKPSFSDQALQDDPKLAYLAKRYGYEGAYYEACPIPAMTPSQFIGRYLTV